MSKHKLVIVGSGPAGYAAAVYAARAQLQPLMVAGEKSGGQLMLTTKVENYPGFPEGVYGPELMAKMRQQAEQFGTKILDQDVLKVELKGQGFKVWVGHHEHKKKAEHIHVEHMHGSGEKITGESDPNEGLKHGDAYQAEAVIIATGAEAMTLGVPGELEYVGRGVSYCAVCDAAFFKERRVFVVGGGDAAMEDTLALTKFASKITIVHRRDVFRASKIMQERVLSQTGKVEVKWQSEVVEVIGNGQILKSIRIKDKQTGVINEEAAEGLFVAIGHTPATEFLEDQVELDKKGYIKTGVNYGRDDWLDGYPTMTSVPGVFAAGDNVDFRYQQAVTAAGMGVMAALDTERWLERK